MRRSLAPLLPTILAVTYLATWLSFAVAYWRAANESAGKAFIFQDNVGKAAHAKAIASKIKVHSDAPFIKIALDEAAQRPLEFVPLLDHEGTSRVARGTIGENWARFFEEWTADQGLSHMSYVVLAKPTEPDRLYRVRLDFYKQPTDLATMATATEYERIWIVSSYDASQTSMYPLPSPEQAKTWVASKHEVILLTTDPNSVIDEYLSHSTAAIRASGIHPLPYLQELLRTCASDPGDAISAIQEVAAGKYEYDLEDFMYFSAITITTVGYGDILPNSKYVRRLVMCESLLGVICIGAFISAIFAQHSKPAKR